VKNLLLGAFALAAVTVAAPVAAVQVVTFDFSGAPQAGVSLSSLGVTHSGVTLAATARRCVALPDTLAQLTDTLPVTQIRSPTPGIGVTGGADSAQIDTNLPNARKAVLVSGSSSFSLRGFQLSEVDFNDIL
jgi:hypothetical protein